MKDIILDILKYTAGVGFFECLKIQNSDEETTVQADYGPTRIVLNAKTKERVTGFTGDFGFSNLSYLKGLANMTDFRDPKSTMNIIEKDGTGDRAGQKYLEIIEYHGDDAIGTYRVMHVSTIPTMPTFKGVEWDISVVPLAERIEKFAQFAALYADIEDQFIVKTVDNNLVFYIGEEGAATHKVQFVFAHDITVDKDHEIKAGLKWKIDEVLPILRLCATGECSMKISKKGIICVSIDSGLVDYNFFVLANQK